MCVWPDGAKRENETLSEILDLYREKDKEPGLNSIKKIFFKDVPSFWSLLNTVILIQWSTENVLHVVKLNKIAEICNRSLPLPNAAIVFLGLSVLH